MQRPTHSSRSLYVTSEDPTLKMISSTRSDSSTACLPSKRSGICSSQTGHGLVSARFANEQYKNSKLIEMLHLVSTYPVSWDEEAQNLEEASCLVEDQ